MTTQELIDAIGANPVVLLIALGLVVACASMVGRLHSPGRGTEPPWRYVYALLVYLACIPGVLAVLLVAYTVLFLRASLLQVDVFVYFAPILAMAATLVLIRRRVDLDEIPGTDRLAGLIVAMAASFLIVFALSRLFVGVIFFGPVTYLIVLCVVVFGILRWSLSTALGRRSARASMPPRI